ncbi:UDP-N-acetylglucosamine 2-epimerase (hydrolyzing) [Prochlorococcus marinus str. MU1404]|uniref:UDP-N-acetylglucosamine 2-epimerase n=1 Tax=Prochlorococcus marinus TaxID=1219 RepID=UPI001ADB2F17|nr:UDP-N-acetylglucosamine 2-epimerase [Prochlorococcus marinus]MBO8230555.1 UDP-N-acetylglucosamine 2-epimerase (hydrolyzing) [Prochlorococcus marinus XMU1404]MBW3073601.1 UDP-N-acetylglucosamine 2-epimerase (hydrolyzing) [Prochlorococcus marinus str. MU1404]MCR8545112.1 UDP-N-acetylglucosamine 2-epimerase [Prochlorococcus marinus CUG1432]
MRKICIIVNSRANYGRIKTVLQALKNDSNVQLQIIVGASAVLERFGNVSKIISNDGFKIDSMLYSVVEGENPTTMAKSTGLAIIELSTIFENLKPDVVLTVADRYETLATAIASSYMNIPLAHTQGGEVTGSIDESVRHAITKLAHLHFPATKLSEQNLLKLGEDPSTIYMTGCPAMDIVASQDLTLEDDFFVKYKGVGPNLDPHKPYLVVLQHPVTTEYGQGFNQIKETIKAVQEINIQTVWLWPNIDAGSDEVSKGIRIFRERENPSNIHFYKNFSPEDYIKLIGNCICQVGNSSSALREGSFLGVPVVNIGTRQNNRECAENVIHVDHNFQNIKNAINYQIKHSKYESSKIFGDGDSGKKIAKILAKAEFKIQKKLHFLN